MDKWIIYQQENGDWRWTRKTADGEILDASAEGFRNRADAVADARRNGYTGN